ncbi:MAG: Protein-export membrane protein SecF [uncultured Pyrinomonadaceae bacterium]|uniref:Protein-export membrane protein SecF n=1 Tax=uncultured Pyrinomonadaceae bacterium TaxID=2283094 RepID=A0A6J4N6R1_9BACT|nr:MAG: Protein-export membrane protein SecF [uncultured Pyrinomonadaceae bacterium]
MFQIFPNINVDWMGWRKPLIAVSILLLLAGLISAVGRQLTPGGTNAFNLGVDFQGGTFITAKFQGQKPSEDAIRQELQNVGVSEAVIQASTDKQDEVLIKVPLIEGDAANQTAEDAASQNAANTNQSTDPSAQIAAENQAQNNLVNAGRNKVREALNTFGKEAEGTTALTDDPNAAYKIVGTDYVGPVAGEQLRNQAVIATLLGLVGILLFIAFRYDWTYAAGAVIAVFHDVLITLAFFSIFQWEVSLTVLAALLTLVGFSVNDSIVIFDRIRENLRLYRDRSLYALTNQSINQTMSRTIVTNGLVFLSVLALVLFGGEVLRGFSLALFVGCITGTYSTIAIASPIAIWWQDKLGAAEVKRTDVQKTEQLASASRRSVSRRPIAR